MKKILLILFVFSFSVYAVTVDNFDFGNWNDGKTCNSTFVFRLDSGKYNYLSSKTYDSGSSTQKTTYIPSAYIQGSDSATCLETYQINENASNYADYSSYTYNSTIVYCDDSYDINRTTGQCYNPSAPTCDDGYKLVNDVCVPDCNSSMPSVAEPPQGWVTYFNIFSTADECLDFAKNDTSIFDDINFNTMTDSRGCIYTVCYINQTSMDYNDTNDSSFQIVAPESNDTNSSYTVSFIDEDNNDTNVTIDTSLGIVASVFESKFDTTNKNLENGFNSLNFGISNMNSNLGSKLDSTNNKLDTVNDNLSSINSNIDDFKSMFDLSDLVVPDMSQYTDFYNNIMQDLDTLKSTFEDTFATVQSGFDYVPPTVNECINPSITFHGKEISIDLCTPFSAFRPLVTFLFTIMGLLASLKIYLIGFKI